MNRSSAQIWEAALGELELQVTKANFQTWLRDTIGLSWDDKCFVVGVANTFAIEWLDKRLSHIIKKTLSGIIGHSVDVQFQISQDPHSEQKAPALNESLDRNESRANFNPKYSFSSYIVGSCNRLAHAAALGVSEKPGAVYNPLFIYGGVGLGKTHLMHAIGHSVLQRSLKVIYVTAEQFTNEFIASIRGKSTEEFRGKYRTVDVLLIDDIQFIAGKEQTQESLFHTFNDLHTANRQIILSSDRPPKVLSLLEDRLRSRFEWGLTVDIQPPDFETRIAILQSKAEEYEIAAAPDVLHLIARRAQNNIRELEGALNRVIAFANLTNSPISLNSATLALMEIGASEAKTNLTTELILNAVAEYFKVDLDNLRGKRRDKAIAFPRQIAMYLLREELSLSWTDIGKNLGGRDHSTILHGHEKIAEEIEASSTLRRDVLEIKEFLYSKAAR